MRTGDYGKLRPICTPYVLRQVTTFSEVVVGRPTFGSSPAGPDSGPNWVKSSLSFSNGNCVEVAHLPGRTIGLRDSKDPHGPVLRFTPDEWQAFLGGARLGEFDQFGAE